MKFGVRKVADEKGAALIITLWFLGAIGLAATLLFLGGSGDRVLVAEREAQTRTDLILEAALLKGLGRFANQGANWPLTDDGARHADFAIDGQSVAVSLRDEGGKVDLNFASQEMLQTAALAAGQKRGDAMAFARSILRARKKTGALKALSDLPDYAGISAEQFRALLPFVTIYGLVPRIDGLMAPEALIVNMPWASKGDARAYLQYRTAYVASLRNGGTISAVAPPQRLARQFQRSPALYYRLTATTDSPRGNAVKKKSILVFLSFEPGDPFRIISYD